MVSGVGGGMPQDFEAYGCFLLLGELPDDRQALHPCLRQVWMDKAESDCLELQDGATCESDLSE